MLEGLPHLEALLFAKHAHCMAVMCSEGVKACGKCVKSLSSTAAPSLCSVTKDIALGAPKQITRLHEHCLLINV